MPSLQELQAETQRLQGHVAHGVESYSKGYKDLLARQKAEQEGLFGQYTTTLAGQEKLPVLYDRLRNELGIPELTSQAQVFKDQIYSTKGLLDSLEDDINSRTSGSFTTEAQRNRQLVAERQPLQTTLARLGTGLEPIADMITGAQGQLAATLPLYVQQQQKELQPLEMRINSISDRFAREITGYTSTKQAELDNLVNMLSRSQNVTDREWQRLQDLAAEEREFTRQKALIAQQNKGLQLGTGNNSGSGVGTMQQRVDAGYNFTNAQGKPVSAYTYAQQNKLPFVSLLQQMGSAGDTTAARMYNFITNTHGGDLGKVMKTNAWNNMYNSLTWGSK